MGIKASDNLSTKDKINIVPKVHGPGLFRIRGSTAVLTACNCTDLLKLNTYY